MCFNSKAMPTTNTDYSYHIKLYTLFNQPYGSISYHIMLLYNKLFFLGANFSEG